MKKFKLAFLLLTIFVGFGISSCGEEEPEMQEDQISITCLAAGDALIASSSAFQADSSETNCLSIKSDVIAFLAACDIDAFIEAGFLTQEEYDAIRDEFDNIDCSLFP